MISLEITLFLFYLILVEGMGLITALIRNDLPNLDLFQFVNPNSGIFLIKVPCEEYLFLSVILLNVIKLF